MTFSFYLKLFLILYEKNVTVDVTDLHNLLKIDSNNKNLIRNFWILKEQIEKDFKIL